MSLLKNLFSSKTTEDLPVITTEAHIIYAPLSGQVIPLADLADGVFSEGILGQGCAIVPEEENVYAPFDGKIVQVADTKHAVGIESNDGIELLIHVGIDTVSMNGDGFVVSVKEGDTVTCGQHLFSFSKKAIANAGFPNTTVVIVTNSDDFAEIETISAATVEHQGKLLHVN